MQQIFEHALQSLVDGVVVVDSEGRILVFNAALETMSGVSATRAVGQPLETIFVSNPQIAELQRRALRLEQSHVAFDTTLERHHAPPLPVGISVSPVQDADGATLGVSVLVRDLSRRRDLETQLRRASTLNQFGTLAAGLAHEIKNPLAGIRGAAQLWSSALLESSEKGSGGDARSEQAAYPALITREVDRINALVEQLLDAARMPQLNLKQVNIHEALDAVVLLESQVDRPAPITWEKQYDPSLPELRADADQLHQLFLNLVRNAAEALDGPGRVTLRTSIGPLQRRVSDAREGPPSKPEPMISIAVSDDGPGIPEEILPHVFTPFFSTKERGVGLGLMLTQQIVERHAGMLTIDSGPNKGATATVILPINGPSSPA